MEELLPHEKLRKIEYFPCIGESLEKNGFGKANCSLPCPECLAKLLSSVADEIERHYVPRPRPLDETPETICEVGPGQRVKRPAPKVLGADGLPIEVGETVYDIESGDRHTVRLSCAGTGKTFFCDGHYSDPAYLTHTPPDTQERIDADAVKECDEYWGCRSAYCKNCPAKIDGEKPWQRYGVRRCRDAMVLDLLRRQGEMDARIGGAG